MSLDERTRKANLKIGGMKGGLRTAELHPEQAREAGRLGGQIAAHRHPFRRTKEWSLLMHEARKRKKRLSR